MKRTLILGRFQPPHKGHLKAIEDESARSDEVIVVIGSAQASFTSHNPFTAGERIEMLQAALKSRGVDNVLLVPAADLNRHAEWVAYVESLVPSFDEVVSNNPLTQELFERAGYKVRSSTWFRRKQCSGTVIRKKLESGGSVADLVDPPVLDILKGLRTTDRLRRVREDRH